MKYVKTWTKEQRGQIIDILKPLFDTTEDGRRALIVEAFGPKKPIVYQLTFSGSAVTFASNAIDQLYAYDGVTAVAILLESIRDNRVGPTRQAEIDAVLATLSEEPGPPAPAAIIVDVPNLNSPLFISYSRKNKAFVNRLRDDLDARGIPYWVDKEGLSPGTPNWERTIRDVIRESSGILWIVSPDSYKSEFVKSEIAVAKMHKRKIYPIFADGDDWVACVWMGYHSTQYVDMREDKGDYNTGLESLLAAIGTSASDLAMQPEQTPDLPANVTPRNPYKGLAAFTEQDTADFFGREALVASLVQRISAQLSGGRDRFLAILGPSGTGKSSVAMAGLLPELQQGAIEGSESWHYLPTIVPGEHPMEHLAESVAVLSPDDDVKDVQERLFKYGVDYLNIVFGTLQKPWVLLYIDQFEELFTLTEADVERVQFISLLVDAVTDPKGKLIVLLSMRADFMAHPLRNSQLASLFKDQSEFVQPMSIAELRDAVERPALLPDVGLEFDEGLVADIVFSLRKQNRALSGALPLLQFTLVRLYEKRKGTLLTREAYDSIGGVAGAIGIHGEAVYAKLPEEAKKQLGTVFLQLVNINDETGEPTRRRATLDSVMVNPNAELLANSMVEEGLLQRGRDQDSVYVEVAHEALLQNWPRLKDLIEKTHDELRLLREMRRAAKLWDEEGRTADFLWIGDRSEAMLKMLRNLQPRLTDVEKDFSQPEYKHLLDEIADIDTTHPRRFAISTRLHDLGYSLPGGGLREDGLPDIKWCYVNVPEELRGKKIPFVDQYGEVFGEFELEPFYISKYRVTHPQFQVFVDSPDGFRSPKWWSDMPTQYKNQEQIEPPAQPYLNYPRDSVKWYQAVAYCRWLSEQLPFEVRLLTEQEWQWAAQNGTEERLYPWGNEWDDRRCNTKESGLGRPIAVGLYPHGVAACGAHDMVGHLWGWCANDWYHPENTDVDPEGNSRRVLRGGSWKFKGDGHGATTRFRLRGTPHNRLPMARSFRLCRPVNTK